MFRSDRRRSSTPKLSPFKTPYFLVFLVLISRHTTPSMSLTSPIHVLLADPSSSQYTYLVSSASIHKYNLSISAIENTYQCSEGSFPQFICVTEEWIFFSGGNKKVYILNAQTLENVANLYSSLIPLPPSFNIPQKLPSTFPQVLIDSD